MISAYKFCRRLHRQLPRIWRWLGVFDSNFRSFFANWSIFACFYAVAKLLSKPFPMFIHYIFSKFESKKQKKFLWIGYGAKFMKNEYVWVFLSQTKSASSFSILRVVRESTHFWPLLSPGAHSKLNFSALIIFLAEMQHLPVDKRSFFRSLFLTGIFQKFFFAKPVIRLVNGLMTKNSQIVTSELIIYSTESLSCNSQIVDQYIDDLSLNFLCVS